MSARFNVFEGSRRIALLIKALWAVGAVVAGWTSQPYVSMAFSTFSPDADFVKSDDARYLAACDIDPDAIEFISRPIGDGRTVSVHLCFKATRADSGQQLVPYKVEGGRWWLNGRYTSDVTNYIKARAESFKLSEADLRTAQSEWRSQRTTNIRNGVLFAIGGWVVLSLLQMLVGWIVRGFVGIPWGQDRRPEPPKTAQ